MRDRLVITCEHGGNRVPARYRGWFRGHEALLASHRGHDRGARSLARTLAQSLGAPLHIATTTRLLVDLNRSRWHPKVFSEITRPRSEAERRELMRYYYEPYRRRVESYLRGQVRAGYRVVHVSVHSFAPVIDGHRRNADIGLLYDPDRTAESALARAWRRALKQRLPGLCVRRNYPYRGKADGFTTYLRRRLPEDTYLGLEVELNQRLVVPRTGCGRLLELMAESLQATLAAEVSVVAATPRVPHATGTTWTDPHAGGIPRWS